MHKVKSLNNQPGIFNESSLSRTYRTECMYLYLLSRISFSGRVFLRGLTYFEGIIREQNTRLSAIVTMDKFRSLPESYLTNHTINVRVSSSAWNFRPSWPPWLLTVYGSEDSWLCLANLDIAMSVFIGNIMKKSNNPKTMLFGTSQCAARSWISSTPLPGTCWVNTRQMYARRKVYCPMFLSNYAY